MSYCTSPYAYRRRATRVVQVGDVAVGGLEPIRVQSMTTPPTTETAATVDQIEHLVDAGCEIVRLTVPSIADAENLPDIRREMRRRRIAVPLVADIHFSPAAAMASIEHVEKVRVNPGNYVDSRRFEQREYTDAEYAEELDRIYERFTPLVRRAKELGVAMRIGTNHGSLSDRIVNRYGDSPEGMVESALEFVRVAQDHDYHDLILSMKSSNPMIMIQAYRVLAAKMAEEKMDYPFHLGVTEAGEGEDGRVKSAVGIGALLEDGIGDTIRVSLTEDPVSEIPVARQLAKPFDRLQRQEPRPLPRIEAAEARDPFRYGRRGSSPVDVDGVRWGGGGPPQVEVALDDPAAAGAGSAYAVLCDVVGAGTAEETRPDLAEVSLTTSASLPAFRDLRCRADEAGLSIRLSARLVPDRWDDPDAVLAMADRVSLVEPAAGGVQPGRWIEAAKGRGKPLLWELPVPDVGAMVEAADRAVQRLTACREAGVGALIALRVEGDASEVGAYRLLAARMAETGHDAPLVLLHRSPDELAAVARLGSLLCDGIGDAIRLEVGSVARQAGLAFTLLQGTRLRMSRTEFISCPSCGRTLFDLESTTRRIKEKTGHLKGVKIAIMGCIVNGPGEMADADFGYVGGAPGKVNLFVGLEMVERHVPAAVADDRLIELIRSHGRWIDPPTTVLAGAPGQGSVV